MSEVYLEACVTGQTFQLGIFKLLGNRVLRALAQMMVDVGTMIDDDL